MFFQILYARLTFLYYSKEIPLMSIDEATSTTYLMHAIDFLHSHD